MYYTKLAVKKMLKLIHAKQDVFKNAKLSILWIRNPEQPASWAKGCDATCTNCGKIAFADSGTALHYCIDQIFMLRFNPIWTFFRHTVLFWNP